MTRLDMIQFLMKPFRHRLDHFSMDYIENLLKNKPKKVQLTKNVLKQEEQNAVIQCFADLDTFGEHVISTKQLL